MMDLVDYSSLSFRLATNPPKTLLTAWKPHTHVHSLVFNDAHALLVIPIEEFENWTGGIPTRGDYKVVYDSIGENLFKGIIAFRLKNYEECITIMKGLDLEAIGGSNAQREVFEEMVEIAVSFTKTIAA